MLHRGRSSFAVCAFHTRPVGTMASCGCWTQAAATSARSISPRESWSWLRSCPASRADLPSQGMSRSSAYRAFGIKRSALACHCWSVFRIRGVVYGWCTPGQEPSWGRSNLKMASTRCTTFTLCPVFGSPSSQTQTERRRDKRSCCPLDSDNAPALRADFEAAYTPASGATVGIGGWSGASR
jgi:hypothetical protein